MKVVDEETADYEVRVKAKAAKGIAAIKTVKESEAERDVRTIDDKATKGETIEEHRTGEEETTVTVANIAQKPLLQKDLSAV